MFRHDAPVDNWLKACSHLDGVVVDTTTQYFTCVFIFMKHGFVV